MSQNRSRLLRYFEYGHLPERLQEISRPFSELAENLHAMSDGLDDAEVEAALRKLLESKDCAVRAALR